MPWRGSSSLLPAKVLFEADEALVAEDDVVDQLDVQDAPRRQELLRRHDILRGGSRVAAGMVVAEDEPRAVADDGGTEDLGGAQHRAVGGPLVEAHLLDQLAPCVQQQDARLLCVQVGHVHHHQVGRILRGGDLVAYIHLHQGQPAPELQGRLHLGRLGLAHAVLGAQLLEICPHQPGQSPVLGEQLVGQLQGIVAAGAGAQDDGQQLGLPERPTTVHLRRKERKRDTEAETMAYEKPSPL